MPVSGLVKTYGLDDVPRSTLVLVSLFHDWGKIGSLDDALYLPQTSDWHYERGMVYRNNNELVPYMDVSDRSLWLLQHFGVRLTCDEFVAIRLHDGMYADGNRSYGLKEPSLSLGIHHSDRRATEDEKRSGKRSIV